MGRFRCVCLVLLFASSSLRSSYSLSEAFRSRSIACIRLQSPRYAGNSRWRISCRRESLSRASERVYTLPELRLSLYASVPSQDDSISSGSPSPRSPAKALHPLLQLACTFVIYAFHTVVLSQHHLIFPFQLIPNDKGNFSSVGWDSIVGMTAFALFITRRLRNGSQFEAKPWQLPNDSVRFRITTTLCVAALIQAYFWTGRFSLLWEDTIYALSGLGFYVTAPMQRALCVLLGHVSWVAVGAMLLRWIPRPPPFFFNQSLSSKESKSRWFRSRLRSNWLGWVVGGYFVSSWLFNIADCCNQYILPLSVLQESPESVVTQLVQPENNDFLASLVGYIAPCLSAPWWEEILYRGFLLPTLTQVFGFSMAVFWQGIIFSAHHMSLTAALPLAVLGWTWALLYTYSQNLWTVILVHALWNSRVFLGSWLGL